MDSTRPMFSIRWKFLAVMMLLLGACVSLYLLLAVKVFKDDKTELIFDLNRSRVTNLGSEIENQLKTISERLETFALLSNQRQAVRVVLDDLLGKDSDVIYVSLQRDRGTEVHYVNETFLRQWRLKEEFFKKTLPEGKPVPLQKIRQTGEEIWNATLPEAPLLLGYGRSVIREGAGGVPVETLAVVAYFRADRILKTVQGTRVGKTFVVTSDGRVLVHPEPELMTGAASLLDHPLVKGALTETIKTKITRFTQNEEKFLGGFSHAYHGKAVVVTEVPSNQAFQAVESLVTRSLVFGSIVVTIAFLAAILLSRSLTKPLKTLMGGMSKVAEGDLSTEISIRSRDEIAVLAERFNLMIKDLRMSREQLEEINRDLENKVRERTSQLQERNEAVKEAQEALLRTTRLAAVGEIAGRAAHEVLNPLTSLMARVGIVQKRTDQEVRPEIGLFDEIREAWKDEYSKGGFEALQASWKKPSDLEPGTTLWDEDLLNLDNFSERMKSEADKLISDTQFLMEQGNRINRIVGGMRSLSVVHGNPITLNAKSIIHESVNIMGDLFGQTRVEIKEEHQNPEALISVDKDEFVQGVTNLLRNSLQAVQSVPNLRDDQGRVLVRSFVKDDQLWVEIEDNGIGIKKENEGKLFESQFTTKSRDEGTGLGLSISRRFIRAFGGDIVFVESKPLYSTVFRITLPLVEKGDEEVAA